MIVHEDYHEMIPAHALSALDAADEDALGEHLSECAECRIELDEWESTAASLAVVAEPVEPSPLVRERILSAVRQSVPLSQADSKSERSESSVIPFTSPSRNIWSSFGSVGAIAAVVLFAVLIVSVVILWRENRAAQSNLASISNQLKAEQEELQRSTEFVQLLTTPGARMTELAGTNQAAGATAKLAYDKTGHAMLVANGLPSAPEGKEYQLWFIVGSTAPMPGRSFSTDSTGRGMLKDQVPEAAMDSAVFAITLEPAGGVNAPTGPICLRSGL